MKWFLILVSLIIVFYIVWAVFSYLYLIIVYKYNIKNFKSIEKLLKERYKLVPYIINKSDDKNIVNGITKYLSELVNLPSEIQNIDRKIALDGELEKLLENIIKNLDINDAQVSSILDSYNDIEQRLLNLKNQYNRGALLLKHAVEKFPSSLIARFLNIKYFDFFKV